MLHVIMSSVHESHPASVISEAIACLHWSGLEETSQETGSWSFDRAGSIVEGRGRRRLRPELSRAVPEWPWHVLLSCGLDRGEHINLKEFRMGGTPWRRLAKRRVSHRLRVPLLRLLPRWSQLHTS